MIKILTILRLPGINRPGSAGVHWRGKAYFPSCFSGQLKTYFQTTLKSTFESCFKKWLREKLTLKERAELLWEITTDLDLDTYEKEDE